MNVIFGGQIFPLCGVITSNGSFKKWGYNIKQGIKLFGVFIQRLNYVGNHHIHGCVL